MAIPPVDFSKNFDLNSDSYNSTNEVEDDQEEVVEEIPTPRLDVNQLQELAQLQLMADQQKLSDQIERINFDKVAKSVQRDIQLEKKLAPISLTDLVHFGEVTQEVPIDEKILRVKFRTIPARFVIAADEVATKVALTYADIKSAEVERHRKYAHSTAQTVMSLIEINGNPGPGASIERGMKRDDLVKAVVAKTCELIDDKPYVLVDQLNHHCMNFHARVRQVLAEAGFAEQELKKS